jgi:hypothetical protein
MLVELKSDAKTRKYVVSMDEFTKVCRFMEDIDRDDEVVFRIGDALIHVNAIGGYVFMYIDSDKGPLAAITFTTAQCGDKEVPIAIFDNLESKELVVILGHKVEEVLGPSTPAPN